MPESRKSRMNFPSAGKIGKLHKAEGFPAESTQRTHLDAADKNKLALRGCELAGRLLLDLYAPPSVLINRKSECIGFFGSVQRYLRVADEGEKPQLFAIAREGVRGKLKAALRLVWPYCGGLDHADFERNDRFASLGIAALPVLAEGETFLLVSFVDRQAYFEQGCAPAFLANGVDPAREPDMSQLYSGVTQAGHLACLSPRQRAVLDLVANGRSNKQIAAELGISQRTVETHRVIVMRKLGARNFADLMRLTAVA